MSRLDELSTNIARIRDEIEEASLAAGRDVHSIRLMAVSKTHPYEEMALLAEIGQLLFGENRVQEAEGKLAPKEGRTMQVNLIGHLQSNKARKAVSLFDRIDSVDSLRLARRLASLAPAPYPILLEVNTSAEASKHGFDSEDDLFFALDEIALMPNLIIQGLMTLGPLGGTESAIRRSFSHLRSIFERVEQRFCLEHFDELSMGMSGDFRLAILEGSTCVRIGSAIFGERR